MSIWDYYYKTDDKVDPIITYILLGILVLIVIGISVYKHVQDNKK